MNYQDESANESPMIITVEGQAGGKYVRQFGQEGSGGGAEEMAWLINDLHEELKAWGYHGGEGATPYSKVTERTPSKK